MRRGPLPRHVADVIAAIHERGRRIASPAWPAAEPIVAQRAFYEAWLRAPRAAAVAVMGALSFGALVGSLAGGSAASVFRPLIVALVPHAASPAPVGGAAGAGGPGGGSGGSGGPATITITNPVPSSPTTSSPNNSASAQTTTGTSTTPSSSLPPIKHVFLIVLSDEGYSQTFGHAASDPYLGMTLVKKGELLPNYYAVAPGTLANEIAMVSGQGPTPETASDCPQLKPVEPGVPGPDGQVLGSGCVYPKGTETLADQLSAAHKTWKVYLEDRSPSAGAQLESCRPKLGSTAPAPSSQEPYATWRNPFLYFAGLGGKTACPKTDTGLGQLTSDLKSAARTPAFSYIVPNVCNDGAVACDSSQASPLAGSDAFLKSVVPKIKRSPAYKAGGLIAITFDQAPQSGPNADQSSCCNNPTYPNDPAASSPSGSSTTTGTTPTTTSTTTTDGTTTTDTGTTSPTSTTTGTDTSTTSGTTSTNTTTTTQSLDSGVTSSTGGGGQVGLLLISPYVKANTFDVTDYFNHFSLLASIEQLFGLNPLGYAADRQLPVFGTAVYSNYNGG